MKRAGKFAVVFFIIYIAVLFKITVFRSGFGTHPLFGGSVNTALFYEYIKLLGSNQRAKFIYYFFGNMIWFSPLGYYARHMWDMNLPKAAAAGLLLSLVIETAQYVFAVGISEADDLLLNTAGTLIGYAAAFVFEMVVDKRTKSG